MKLLKIVFLISLIHTVILMAVVDINFVSGESYPSDSIINPPGPQVRQVVTKKVSASAPAKPGIYWYQLDDGSFQADYDNGTHVTASNAGDDKYNPYPVRKETSAKINSLEYEPGNFEDSTKVSVPSSAVEDKKLVKDKTSFGDAIYFTPGENMPNIYILSDNISIGMNIITGGPNFTNREELDIKHRPNGFPKYLVEYDINLNLTWEGTAKEIKEMRVTPASASMKPGEKKNFKAEVRTKPFSVKGDTSFGDFVDVTTRTETVWSSDNKAVATVDSSGNVTAVGKGTAKITAVWKSGLYYLYGTATVTVGDGGGDGPPPVDPPDPGVSCTEPAPGQSMTGKYMDPVVTGKIKADARGSERFDVLQGIPTSESLYGNVLARNHLYQDKFVQMTGTCTYTVNVTKEYTLKWDPGKEVPNADGKGTHIEPDPQSETESKTFTYQIERRYAFWKIDNLEVYQIREAILDNYALPGGRIAIQPSGYSPPYYAAATTGNYDPPAPPGELTAAGQTLTGGKSKPSVPNDEGALKGEAEKAVGKIQVTNDSLVFNGQTMMNNQKVEESGPTPSQIPEPPQIGDNVLYSPGNLIDRSKTNKKDTPSAGKIEYDLMPGNINGGQNQEFPIYGINTVTVHTPVVNYSSVSDDAAHNQKTNPDAGRSALILERPFTVRIPTSGQHVSYPGYGNRDYAKYFRTKQVKFPFDVYDGNRTTFIPKNTWVDIPVGQLDTTFYLPVWVDEGPYQIAFRNIAENAPADYTQQNDANTSLVHHAAYDEVAVDVIGRLYDFHVTDIADYNWETVFRSQKGSAIQTGVSYWVGQKGIDGDPRGNAAVFTLPIRPGSSPLQGFKNVSVKTGYHFKFDFKTKGNMFGPLDGIRITPTFYYVRKDGKAVNGRGDTRIPVDLYYSTSSKHFVKIGSSADQVQRYVILNDRLRNVPAQELRDTAGYKFNHGGAAGGMNRNEYINSYVNKYTKQKTPVGSYSLLILPEQLRTFLSLKDPVPESVNRERADVSIQKWYGEYSLPADPYVVEAGTNVAEYGRTHGGLDDKSPIFLKNGYIVVNFNIESIQAGDLKNPHLQYIYAPLMNQWQMEGFNRNIQDAYGNRFALKDGDVVFYQTDQSSRDDFSSQVPH